MDRQIIYPGQIPLETDLLNTNKNTMIALSKLAAAMLGTSTVVNGLTVGPNSPAALNVVVSAGEIYALTSVDANAYSSIAADTTHLIVKQGVSLDPTTVPCPAPSTAGFSINYLIQAAFSETDGLPVALPYYNSSNPSQAFSGPGNNGAAQNTRRYGLAVVNAKAGAAATTGTQTTPSPDAGFVGLAVVTVAFGQTTITSSNITAATNAPVIPSGGVVPAIQASGLIVGTDTGTANACVVNYSYPVTALKDGMVLWFKPAAANTGATTLNVNGLGAYPILGAAHTALQGGEIVLNGKCQVVWNLAYSSWVLIECTGAAIQVAPATQSQHAMQLGQATGRLLNIQYFTSSGTYTPSPGTTSIIVEAVGGGGAGGGATSAASNVSAGGSGSAGGWGYKRITSGFSGASVTIGAKGTGVAGAAGGNGTTTSFGAFLSVLGGGGGGAGVAAAVVGIAGSVGAASGVGAGADVGASGQVGNPGVILSPTSGFGGVGAVSRFGSGGLFTGLNGTGVTAGGNASGFGASGSGAIGVNNGATAAGGNGAPGLIIVYEYA
ncbi:phage tail protein [Cupriavidus metallidurans]|uniref:Phage tail protein n=1 Tax=Cupriavidus metallidurans TaxID=119219 RepID=A0A482IN69_9BURK|nr:phage tail protein [Cupriavidus metallidurans]QBP09386.1 phage tail protein [Cupriavidus metallidurans]